MEFYYEPIETDKQIQAKILCHSVGLVPHHWHNSYELLLVLSGKIMISIDGKEMNIESDSVLMINPNQIHALTSVGSNQLLAIQIPSYLIENTISKTDGEYNIDCNSHNEVNQSKYDLLKFLMVTFAYECDKKTHGYIAKAKSLLYEIIYELLNHFSSKSKSNQRKIHVQQIKRLTEIMEYIRLHSSFDLSLGEVAKVHGLSPNYFSNYFKKYSGTTFLNYLNNIRLDNSLHEIIYTDESITNISENNGFPNIRAFENVFKNRFSKTPSSYRNDMRSFKAVATKNNTSDSVNYFAIEGTDKFGLFKKYLDKGINQTSVNSYAEKNTVKQEITLNMSTKGTSLKHTWKKITSIGMASDGLKSSVQNQLIEAQKEIGFEYIRFHGLLDDAMMVYNEDNNGKPKIYFGRIFELFDFILSIGLRPFVEISFMPSKLAKKQNTFFNSKSVMSVPNNVKNWCTLITSLLNALVERYGINEVEVWFFEFWNEPECFDIMWSDGQEDYLSFYKTTYDVFKKTFPNFSIGGPAIASAFIFEDWFLKYVNFCDTNNCVPDFFSYHVYPVENDGSFDMDLIRYFNIHSDQNYIPKTKVSSDIDFLKNRILEVNKTLKKFGWDTLPQYITEWNSTSWHWDLCSDTCYKSAYIAKNISETLDMIDGLTLWTLSDNMDELFLSNDLFHGGLGLMTVNGIKKAGYYAMCLLKKLGNQLLFKDSNFILTSDNNYSYQLLIYNYSHYDSNYSSFDTSFISKTIRNNVFADKKTINFEFTLSELPYTKVTVRKTKISSENGSSYNSWLKMGAPKGLNFQDIEVLKNVSTPIYNIAEFELKKDEHLTLNAFLNSQEIMLFEITLGDF